MATNPAARPSSRRFQLAGKARTADPKSSAVSTPLQPFSMLTPNDDDRISVPTTSAFSPKAFNNLPETEAIAAVNGMMTASLTGCDATIR